MNQNDPRPLVASKLDEYVAALASPSAGGVTGAELWDAIEDAVSILASDWTEGGEPSEFMKELGDKAAIRLSKAADAVRAAAPEQPRTVGSREPWISTDTRPESDRPVLVWDGNSVLIGIWLAHGDKWCICGWDEYHQNERPITHWKPMPAAPEGSPVQREGACDAEGCCQPATHDVVLGGHVAYRVCDRDHAAPVAEPRTPERETLDELIGRLRFIAGDSREISHADQRAIGQAADELARPTVSHEPDPTAMLADDCNRMRGAGNRLAQAALRVIETYDGTHRLALAVSEWAQAIASEGGRPQASRTTTRNEVRG